MDTPLVLAGSSVSKGGRRWCRRFGEINAWGNTFISDRKDERGNPIFTGEGSRVFAFIDEGSKQSRGRKSWAGNGGGCSDGASAHAEVPASAGFENLLKRVFGMFEAVMDLENIRKMDDGDIMHGLLNPDSRRYRLAREVRPGDFSPSCSFPSPCELLTPPPPHADGPAADRAALCPSDVLDAARHDSMSAVCAPPVAV